MRAAIRGIPGSEKLIATLSPVAKRLLRGTSWMLMATMISRVLALIGSVLVARFLGKEGFGELGMLQGTTEMFGSLAAFSLGDMAAKHVAEFRVTDPDRARRIIGMSSVVAWLTGGTMLAALMVVSPWLCRVVLNAPQLWWLFEVSAAGLLVGAVNGAQAGALMGFEAFREDAMISLYTSMAILVGRCAGAYWFGLQGAIWGQLAAGLFGCVANSFMLRKVARRFGIRLTYLGSVREMRILWHFSFPAVTGGLMITGAAWLCNAMLVHKPNGYSELGIFNAALQWYYAPLLIPGLVGRVLLPVLSERLGIGDIGESRKLLRLSITVNTVMMLPVLLLPAASKLIMRSYGNGFEQGWPVLALMLAAGFVLSVQMPLGHVLAASGRMWTMLAINAVFSVSLVGGSWLLINQEATGLAWARLGCNVLLLGISVVVIKRLVWGRAPAEPPKTVILAPVALEEF